MNRYPLWKYVLLTVALLVGLIDAVNHRLHRGLDSHERRAEFVGHIGGEAAFKLTIFLHRIGHLVKRLAKLGDLIFP